MNEISSEHGSHTQHRVEMNAIKASRTMHDAALLAGGARYEGEERLLVTDPQVERLRMEHENSTHRMGHLAIADTSELLHHHLDGEFAEREALLKDRIHSVAAPYINALSEHARSGSKDKKRGSASIVLPGIGTAVRYDLDTRLSERTQELKTTIDVSTETDKTSALLRKIKSSLDVRIQATGGTVEEMSISGLNNYNGAYEATIKDAIDTAGLACLMARLADGYSGNDPSDSKIVFAGLATPTPSLKVTQKKGLSLKHDFGEYAYLPTDGTDGRFYLSTNLLMQDYNEDPSLQPANSISPDEFLTLLGVAMRLVPTVSR